MYPVSSLSIGCRELSRFIAVGRLNCKIDKVAGVVETNRPDAKNALYQVCPSLHEHPAEASLLTSLNGVANGAPIDGASRTRSRKVTCS
eukprot:scaffold2591_cov417-Prasinococcus_capsulatus_cf.AAC.4